MIRLCSFFHKRRGLLSLLLYVNDILVEGDGVAEIKYRRGAMR